MNILYIDVSYSETKFKAVGGLFHNWIDKVCEKYYEFTSDDLDISFGDYEPGKFYKREMGIILAFIKHYRLTPDVLVIDGYIFLYSSDGSARDGLGGHVKKALDFDCEVIGVAKNPFANNRGCEVYRKSSSKPLFVQSYSGKNYTFEIQNMFGDYRLPVIFKHVDYLTKHDKEEFERTFKILL